MTNIKKKIFSVPLHPYMTDEEFDLVFLPFLKEHKDYIYDIYFTSRIEPYKRDAMGASDVIDSKSLDQVLRIKEETNINISATYNNFLVYCDESNLKMFINNFKPLYEKGVNSITISCDSWVNELKKEFPNLLIKNTVLKKIQTSNEFIVAAKRGFDYVNIDRLLLRNEDELKKIKKAQLKFQEKTGKYVYTAILANEGCRGNCPTMMMHYTINNSSASGKPGTNKAYFQQKISQFTCPAWRSMDPAYPLKIANIPPFKEDFLRLLDNIDIIKMHGREGLALLNDTIAFITSFVKDFDELHDISVRNFILEKDIEQQKIDMWRKHIRNCKFECWDCKYCDELVQSARNNELSF